MVLDFSYRGLINETIEELLGLSLNLETLFESSYEDVIWFLRLVGGDVIMDHSDSKSGDLIFFSNISAANTISLALNFIFYKLHLS